MIMLRRIKSLYSASLILFLFVAVNMGSARQSAASDQDILMQDDGYTDYNQNKAHANGQGLSSRCGQTTKDRSVLEHKGSGSLHEDAGFFIALLDFLYVSNLYLGIEILQKRASFHSQEFVNSLFHPPKTSRA